MRPRTRRLRALASYAFGPDRVAVLRTHIQEICDRLIDAVLARGKMDVIADLAAPLPGDCHRRNVGRPGERP